MHPGISNFQYYFLVCAFMGFGLSFFPLLVFLGWVSLYVYIGKDSKPLFTMQSLLLFAPLLSLPVIVYLGVNFQAKKYLPLEMLSHWSPGSILAAQWVGVSLLFSTLLVVLNVYFLKGRRRFAIAVGCGTLFIIFSAAGAANWVIAGAWI
jgi:hypothetical protein